MKITRQEIRWMLRFVEESRDNSASLMDRPGQQYAALHKLEYENMSVLAEKLTVILTNNAKRITIE